MVPWMSGLVSGLQNRVRRFESARNLQKQERIRMKISNPFVFQQLTSSVVEVGQRNNLRDFIFKHII